MRRHAALVTIVALLIAVPAIPQPAPSMTAHFIDVGQGHATLLEFPCGTMLIDSGGQDAAHGDKLVAYLQKFFSTHPQLKRTLNSVLITHNHVDHNEGLRKIAQTFTIERYIDHGFTTGSGQKNTSWLKSQISSGKMKIKVRELADVDVEAITDKSGLTDADIDPFSCSPVDPIIRILQARIGTNPGWSAGDFGNPNNHSLITRVDFGTASFLFIGDLQEPGIEFLLGFYAGAAAKILDVDVLQVGHHGSHNATTAALLAAVTPRVALIPVGRWTFGQGSNAQFTTFNFGHPREGIVDLLMQNITRVRRPSKSVMVASGQRQFHSTLITKAIYATGWDGNIRVTARGNNDITVRREF